MYTSPLEQFEIVAIGPFFKLPSLWLGLDQYYLPFTNQSLIMILGVVIIIYLMYYVIITNSTMIPNRYQKGIESIYKFALDLVQKNIGATALSFFPLIFTLILFLFMCNIIGMIPYSFTVTSHIIMTFILAFALFVGVNIIAISKHGLATFKLFLPPGSSLALVPVLVPIEIVSYTFRLISLSVRLFANMLAGHTLLKVIIGFAWSMMSVIGITFTGHIVVAIIGFILVGFEFGVALIQAYVFTILITLYLHDALHLH